MIKELFQKPRFFLHQGCFPQAKIFPHAKNFSTRQFSSRKDFSIIMEVNTSKDFSLIREVFQRKRAALTDFNRFYFHDFFCNIFSGILIRPFSKLQRRGNIKNTKKKYIYLNSLPVSLHISFIVFEYC